MKTQCANLRKVVQEQKKSIREMKTTLEVFKRERGRGRERKERDRDRKYNQTWVAERLGGNYITLRKYKYYREKDKGKQRRRNICMGSANFL